ncbi:DUF3502 domain-containing protein [Paenibacillus sp. WQ 127069]|uniref:DUF3502 domain-containing protein n=1 Tax=Paenibacillus baimaensis TaxID=2982185 RepID=A0ABT2ULT9_9BACL|nr:DUF3502 domain-containing protein [Paenibacillus sp. WQ 127069]MCU6795547.1 DUF3502 domain-containing protein [Paenibacillus sp. WQ 127069]
MNKKPFTTLLAATMLLSGVTLTACSSDTKPSGSTPTTPTAAADTQKPTSKEEEVTLKFYFGGDKKSSTDEVWKAVSDYVKSKGLNVKFTVNVIPFGDPYKEKLLVMSASGDDWDMNYDGDWLAYRQMASKGAYLGLNDLLPKYAPNLNKKYQEQGTLAAATVNGQVVALPWTMKMSQRPFVKWRADLTKKAGIEPAPGSIKTLEDLDNLAHQIRKAYPDMKVAFPVVPTVLSGFFELRDELNDLSAQGGNQLVVELNDSTFKVKALEQTKTYSDMAKYAQKWYLDGIINKDVLVDKEDPGPKFRNGKMLLANSSHEWANAEENFSDKSSERSSSQLYPDKKFPNRTALANVVAINKNSKHPDLVLRFLDMIETDQKLYDLVQYGVEGKNYILDGKTANYPAGMNATTSNYMEWGGQWALWKPQFMRPNPTYKEGFWVKEAEFANDPSNITNPLDGFFVVSDKIKNELAQRDQVQNELGRAIEAGAVKDADKAVSEYIEKQKAAGLDRIIVEVQKQVDAFIAAKKK